MSFTQHLLLNSAWVKHTSRIMIFRHRFEKPELRDVITYALLYHQCVVVSVDALPEPSTKSSIIFISPLLDGPMKHTGFKRRYPIRHVLWLGPAAPTGAGSDSKTRLKFRFWHHCEKPRPRDVIICVLLAKLCTDDHVTLRKPAHVQVARDTRSVH